MVKDKMLLLYSDPGNYDEKYQIFEVVTEHDGKSGPSDLKVKMLETVFKVGYILSRIIRV